MKPNMLSTIAKKISTSEHASALLACYLWSDMCQRHICDHFVYFISRINKLVWYVGEKNVCLIGAMLTDGKWRKGTHIENKFSSIVLTKTLNLLLCKIY